MKNVITPKSRLCIGLILFAGTVALVLARFTTSASFSDIAIIGASSLLVIPCHLALSCHEEWFTPKRKLIMALLLFMAALAAEQILNKGNEPFGDAYMILCFMAVTALCNVALSKWNHSNIALLPHLAFDLCCMAALVLSFNLTSEVEYGDSTPSIGITLSILAMLAGHFLLLKQKEKKNMAKRVLMSLAMTVMVLAGLFVLVVIKAMAA